MMRKSALTFFASALLLTWAHKASAQTPCEDALRDAEKSYELGLFEDVPTKLSPCLGTPTSRSVGIHVHSLLARAYLNNEEPEQARKEISTLLRLQTDYEAEAGSSARFLALVAQVKREEQTTQVVSVSKTSESLREAPATVVVVTGDEIRRRGYLDFEQILHDLPGFDISRFNGPLYSAVYQRGYRSAENDRLLLLVDGVEQNDLSLGTMYMNRQLPLSNIDRVEVIYGPASTMYGANAYTGVISIVTRAPEALTGLNRRVGIAGQITTGGDGSQTADITASGTDRSGTVAWSVTGMFQKSKERNLSGMDFWDYNYRNFDYKNRMRLAGTAEEQAALCIQPSSYIQCDSSGIGLTDAGETLVRDLDRKLIADNHLGFDDRAMNWSLFAKARIANLTIGLDTWRSREGIVSAYGAFGGVAGNTTWTPAETAFYLQYSLPLDRVKVNVFARYEQTTLDRNGSRFGYLHNYAGGFLTLSSLVAPCVSALDPIPVSCAPATPWLETDTFGSLSSQFRNEISVSYEPSEQLSGVSGIEFVKSSIQSSYDQSASGPGAFLLGAFSEKPEQIEHTDAAVYAQGSYKPKRSLRFVLAGRVSYNQINNKPDASGFGTLFTPRVAVIYSPGSGQVVLKAVYAEAFKDPTDAQKFGILPFFEVYRSNGLRPERVRNFELNASWQTAKKLSIEGSLYQAKYANVVSVGYPRLPDGSPVPDCQVGCLQFQNRDQIRIRGLQVTARYKLPATDLWANYTHTEPFQTNPTDILGSPLTDDQGAPVREIRVADIAANQVSMGVDAGWRDFLNAGLRLHYVGQRPTGMHTTSPGLPFNRTDSYLTADASLAYHPLRSNLTLQLIAGNLFNRDYYDPGTNSTVPRVLQAGRTLNLRVVYQWPPNGR